MDGERIKKLINNVTHNLKNSVAFLTYLYIYVIVCQKLGVVEFY